MNLRERRTHDRPADGSQRGRCRQTQNGVVEVCDTVTLTSLARAGNNQKMRAWRSERRSTSISARREHADMAMLAARPMGSLGIVHVVRGKRPSGIE